MKIVISTDLYYPMINGVAQFSRNLAGGLQKRGHEVVVLAPSITGDYEVERDEEYGFRVVRLSSRKLYFYPDQINDIPEAKEFMGVRMPQILYKNGLHVSFNAGSEIRSFLDGFEPDIIHDQTPGPVALSVFRYAKKRDVPLVSTDHAYPDNFTSQLHLPWIMKKPIDSVINKYFVSFLKRSEYGTMPTSQAVSDLIPKKRHRFKVPVEALSNGIDLSRFSPGKADDEIYKKYNIAKTKPTILYIGRIDPEKSLDVLIEAFALVLKKIPNAQLVMVGDGASRNDLEKLAEKLDISKSIRFLGRIIGSDLPKLYRVGKVFAITSKTETQSIVIMEAMATGLPVVAVRAGAIPELVWNNKNGYLCTPDNPTEMARNLTKILKNSLLQRKLSKTSLENIKKHDIGYTLTRFEEIYQTVLDNRNKELKKQKKN
jgi:glycosyltransferase involved in cell wall biosynthesis